jgi:excisionase family DNA binding protein
MADTPPRKPDAEPLLTPQEVATIFRVDPKTVTRWAKAGKLAALWTPGGHRRYRETEVKALLASITQQKEHVPDRLRAPVHTLWPAGVTGMPREILDCFRDAGVATVGVLTRHTASDLAAVGLSPEQVDEVSRVLHRKGFALRSEIAGKAA